MPSRFVARARRAASGRAPRPGAGAAYRPRLSGCGSGTSPSSGLEDRAPAPRPTKRLAVDREKSRWKFVSTASGFESCDGARPPTVTVTMRARRARGAPPAGLAAGHQEIRAFPRARAVASRKRVGLRAVRRGDGIGVSRRRRPWARTKALFAAARSTGKSSARSCSRSRAVRRRLDRASQRPAPRCALRRETRRGYRGPGKRTAARGRACSRRDERPRGSGRPGPALRPQPLDQGTAPARHFAGERSPARARPPLKAPRP